VDVCLHFDLLIDPLVLLEIEVVLGHIGLLLLWWRFLPFVVPLQDQPRGLNDALDGPVFVDQSPAFLFIGVSGIGHHLFLLTVG
jgi:hypothetical protein